MTGLGTYLDGTSKLITVTLGVIYALGMSVVTLHMAHLGLYGPGLLHAQYIIVGFWALAPAAVALAAAAMLISAIIEHWKESQTKTQRATPSPGADGNVTDSSVDTGESERNDSGIFGRLYQGSKRFGSGILGYVGAPLVAVLGFGLMLTWLLGIDWDDFRFPNMVSTTGRLVLLLAIAAFSIRGTIRGTWQSWPSRIVMIAFGAAAFGGYVNTFATTVYPYIPAELGGGRPTPVEFTLSPAGKVAFEGASLQPADGVYQLVLTTADQYFIVHPTDSSRVVGIGRGNVAVVAAGK